MCKKGECTKWIRPFQRVIENTDLQKRRVSITMKLVICLLSYLSEYQRICSSWGWSLVKTNHDQISHEGWLTRASFVDRFLKISKQTQAYWSKISPQCNDFAILQILARFLLGFCFDLIKTLCRPIKKSKFDFKIYKARQLTALNKGQSKNLISSFLKVHVFRRYHRKERRILIWIYT